MAFNVYRDLACTTGPEAVYALYSKLVLHGWTAVAWSDGTTRTAGAGPASAANLSAANAWFVVNHTASGRKFSARRDATLASSWEFQYTDGSVALVAGTATAPDAAVTYTRTFFPAQQWYPTASTTATKAHVAVDDATASFIMALRRTPHPGGDICSIVSLDQVTPLTWAANPDPAVAGAYYSDANTAGSAPLTVNQGNGAWYKRGIAGEDWQQGQWVLENPSGVGGHATLDPSGTDTEYEARWIYTPAPFILGKSTLYRLLQPYRGPTTGLDSGTNFARAAFGGITVPNDGTALGS